MKLDYRIVLLIVLFTLSASWYFFKGYYRDGYNSAMDMNGLLLDSVKTYRNDLGQQIAEKDVLVFERKKDIERLRSLDSQVIRLKDEVRDYKGRLDAASVVVSHTGLEGVNETIIDTTVTDSLISPVYTSSWVNKWEEGFIRARRDSIFHSVKIRNEFVFTVGDEKKNGFLAPRTKVFRVKNLNPNTITEEAHTFYVDETVKRWGIGFIGGYGYSSVDVTRAGWFIGVGTSFNFIRF